MKYELASVLAVAGLAAAAAKPTKTYWPTAYTASDAAAVHAAAATAKVSSPTSHVKGKAFDRVVYIWMENTNFEKALNDPNFKYFTEQGITLTHMYGVTHPSEPNYMAHLAGDYFGGQNDDFHSLPRNISTIIDVLESGGISWAAYQEDMPFAGFEGYEWLNQETGANDYVRKHNPPILGDAVTFSEQRLSQIKNLSMIDESKSSFHIDLKANKLPQWMFITPNMTSDGHDSSVTVAGAWCRNFLEPLLTNKNFMDNTMVVVTWDENETYSIKNKVLGIILGDVVPEARKGTHDPHFYTHYSEIATVEANWDLPTLGRWDVGANVFHVVAEKTGDKLRAWESQDDFEAHFFNISYAGQYNEDGGNSVFPAPNLALDKSFSGRPILQSVKDKWSCSDVPTYYKDTIEIPDGLNPPKDYTPIFPPSLQ